MLSMKIFMVSWNTKRILSHVTRLAAALQVRLSDPAAAEFLAGSPRMNGAVALRDLLGDSNPFVIDVTPSDSGRYLRAIVEDLHREGSPYAPYSELMFPPFMVPAAPRACHVQFCSLADCESDLVHYQRLLEDIQAYREIERIPASLARNCSNARPLARKIPDAELRNIESSKFDLSLVFRNFT
jgi:hypothetical protein